MSAAPQSPETHNSQTGSQQRLLPWLEDQVNSDRYPGLQWLNKDQGIFRMSWRHYGSPHWTEEHALIFKAWAIHKGNYTEGVGEPDWAVWKTRLRNALNKLKPDLVKLEIMSCLEDPDPYQVFQFTNRRGSGSKSSPQGPSSVAGNGEVDRFKPAAQIHHANIPTVVTESCDFKTPVNRQEDTAENEVGSLDSDLKQLSIKDLVPETSIPDDVSLTSGSLNGYAEPMDTGSWKGAVSQPQCQQIKWENPGNPDSSYLHTATNNHEMLVTLRFRNDVICQRTVTNPHGCRVYYGHLPQDECWDAEVLGSREAEQIAVPYSDDHVGWVVKDQDRQTVLGALQHGVSICMYNHCIFLMRRCKARIVTTVANKGEKQTRKLGPNEHLKVFDFQEDFLPAFLQYRQGQGPPPSSRVIVGIGQDFHTEVEPYPNLLLSLTVSHTFADRLLSQHMVDSAIRVAL